MKILNVKDEASVKKYNDLIKKVPMVTLFYADWCGHCQDLKPKWNKLEKSIKDLNDKMVLAKVNNSVMSQIEGDKDILGFPTIFYLEDGVKKKEFNKERSLFELFNFLTEVRPQKKREILNAYRENILQNGGRKKRTNKKMKSKKQRKTNKRKTNKRKR